jgi:hypothetical protein
MRQGASTTQQAGRGVAPDGNRRIVPTIVFHADKDHTVDPRIGDQVIAQSAAAGELRTEVLHGQVPGGHLDTRALHTDAGGQAVLEQWLVHGGGHAWSGGSADGSYTDPRGPMHRARCSASSWSTRTPPGVHDHADAIVGLLAKSVCGGGISAGERRKAFPCAD